MGDTALRFGRYEVLFRIAAGGMAEVFAARVRGEGGFEKLVAIKRMLPHLAQDGQFVQMFLDEARVAATLSSPNVVQTLDIGRTDDGELYIVMEFVLGLSLSELIPLAWARGPLPIPVCVEVLAQVATGLHHAHEARTTAGDRLNLIHRDVSPQNVMIGVDGRSRLTDFGIARVTRDRHQQTDHGTVKGKFAYCSPEQSLGGELDRRSDVFALGIVAWEMLAGRRLFARHSPVDTLEAVRSAEIPPLEVVRGRLPARLPDAVHRALERDPDRRWQAADAMAHALRESLGTVGSTPSIVAEFVRDLRPERVVQLEARVRDAVASPQVRTLPDIEIEAPEDDPDLTVVDHGLDAASGELTGELGAPYGERGPPRRRMTMVLAVGALVALAIAVGLSTRPAPETAPEPVAGAPPPPTATVGEEGDATSAAPAAPLAPADPPSSEQPLAPEATSDPLAPRGDPRAAPRARGPVRAPSSEASPAPAPAPVEAAPPAERDAPRAPQLRPGQVLGIPEGL